MNVLIPVVIISGDLTCVLFLGMMTLSIFMSIYMARKILMRTTGIRVIPMDSLVPGFLGPLAYMSRFIEFLLPCDPSLRTFDNRNG